MAEAPPSRRGLAKGGLLGFAGAACSAILGFLLTLMLTRMLGAGGAGVVMQATGVFSLVLALSKTGMDSTVIFLVPRLRIDSPERISRALAFMSLVAVGASLLASALLFLLAPSVWGEEGGGLVDAVRAIAWFLPANALLLVSTAALRALGGMSEYVLVQNLALPLLRPPAIALTVLASTSPAVVSVSWALPIVLVLAAALLLLRRRLQALPPGPAGARLPDARSMRSIVSFALPRTLAAGLEQAIVWLDVLIVGGLLGSAAAGVYGGASRFIQAGMLVDSALRVVVSPKLSSLVEQGRLAELRELHATATTWLVLFASPIYVLMAVFSPTLMDILGKGFESGAPVVVVLSIGACATFLAGNIHTLLIMSGRSSWAAWNKLIVLVVNILGNLLLLPRTGIIGAAVSWAICMVLDAILASLEVGRLLGLKLGSLQYLRPLLLVLLSVGGPSLLIVAIVGQGIASLLLAASLSLLAFTGACLLLRDSLRLSGIVGKGA